jgi:hypothetical protein
MSYSEDLQWVDGPSDMSMWLFAIMGVLGAFMTGFLGMLAHAFVPYAMSAYGTVVAGVGTFHAAASAGGIAAMLQAASAALLSAKGLAVGAMAAAAASGALMSSRRSSRWC